MSLMAHLAVHCKEHSQHDVTQGLFQGAACANPPPFFWNLHVPLR